MMFCEISGGFIWIDCVYFWNMINANVICNEHRCELLYVILNVLKGIGHFLAMNILAADIE